MSLDSQTILNAFLFRHACKEFDANRTISAADFEFILETGRLSPCSFGLEPWKFLIVQNTALRQKMLPSVWGGQKQIPTASHLIVTLNRKSISMRHDSEYVQDFMRRVQLFPEDAALARTAILKKFQEQDFSLFESERAMTDWSSKQTYIALANMMTAAALIGIDSCPIEGFEQAALQQVLAECCAIDFEAWGLSYLLAFGYRKGPPLRTKTRQELVEIVQWLN